jgi:hypothetical protein
LRIFLASSRSFKDEISKNSSVQADLKDILLESLMPKFVWVAEISTKELIKQKKATGMIVLDATEADTHFNKPLILAFYQDQMMKFDAKTGLLKNYSLPSYDFTIFECNLK